MENVEGESCKCEMWSNLLAFASKSLQMPSRNTTSSCKRSCISMPHHYGVMNAAPHLMQCERDVKYRGVRPCANVVHERPAFPWGCNPANPAAAFSLAANFNPYCPLDRCDQASLQRDPDLGSSIGMFVWDLCLGSLFGLGCAELIGAELSWTELKLAGQS